MRKIETTLLGSVLAVALSAPAMAGDFHALEGLQGRTPEALPDTTLATTEGGATCGITPDFTADGGGAAYCGFSQTTGGVSVVTVGVDIPLTANILTVSVPSDVGL